MSILTNCGLSRSSMVSLLEAGAEIVQGDRRAPAVHHPLLALVHLVVGLLASVTSTTTWANIGPYCPPEGSGRSEGGTGWRWS